jgi:hypothetical protein
MGLTVRDDSSRRCRGRFFSLDGDLGLTMLAGCMMNLNVEEGSLVVVGAANTDMDADVDARCEAGV